MVFTCHATPYIACTRELHRFSTQVPRSDNRAATTAPIALRGQPHDRSRGLAEHPRPAVKSKWMHACADLPTLGRRASTSEADVLGGPARPGARGVRILSLPSVLR